MSDGKSSTPTIKNETKKTGEPGKNDTNLQDVNVSESMKKKVEEVIIIDESIDEEYKPSIINRVLFALSKLGIDNLAFDSLDKIEKNKLIQKEIDDAKREIKIKDEKEKQKIDDAKNGKFENKYIPGKLTAAKMFAVATTAAAGLAGIANAISQNPVLMGMATAGFGVVIASPIGPAVLGTIAIGAVAFYAVLAVKAKFRGIYKILRTLDEFTILLEKIQRMIQVAVFISGTYNFQINVDEINVQIKIILKRFEKTLTEGDLEKITSDVSNAQNLQNLGTNVVARANSASETQLSQVEMADQQQKDTEQVNGQPVASEGQDGRGFFANIKSNIKSNIANIKSTFSKISFPVEQWNRDLLDDVTRLNIRLTTMMGEFTIILNVIQMNLIADGLDPESQTKALSIKEFITHTTEVKNSSQYQRMRIGILINDILDLKVDFDFCNKGSGGTFGTRADDDAICLEYTKTDDAGNRITTFRPKLHQLIIIVNDNLKSEVDMMIS